MEIEVVEHAEFDQLATAVDDPTVGVRFVEQPIEQRLPAVFEREMALEFVEHRETGWQPGGDREIVEESTGERVEGPDRRMVEVGSRLELPGRRELRSDAMP